MAAVGEVFSFSISTLGSPQEDLDHGALVRSKGTGSVQRGVALKAPTWLATVLGPRREFVRRRKAQGQRVICFQAALYTTNEIMILPYSARGDRALRAGI